MATYPQQQFPGREFERFPTREHTFQQQQGQGFYQGEEDRYIDARNEPLEKVGRGDQMEKFGRGEQLEKFGRGEQSEKFGRGEQSEKFGRGEQLEKFGRGEQIEKFGRGEMYGREQFGRENQRENQYERRGEYTPGGEMSLAKTGFQQRDRYLQPYGQQQGILPTFGSGSGTVSGPGVAGRTGAGVPYRGVDRSQGWWKPRAEILETDEGVFRIELELPGVPAEMINLTVEGDSLVLDTVKPQSRKQDAAYKWLSERHFGNFYRKLQLPNNIDGTRAAVALDHGVLKVLLPKSDTPSPRIVIRGNQIRYGPAF